jgi:hypothetical protein
LSEDQIAAADPGHLISDSNPRYLVARKYSSATATAGQVQYEFWPAPTSARTYPILYLTRATTLADADVLPGVLSERADVLRTYVKAQAAMWPGTVDQPNPFFSLANGRAWKDDWEQNLQQLSLADDNEYPQQLQQVDWARRMGMMVGTAALLRQTDATVADYY